MNSFKTDLQLDVKGLPCPMPVVRTKKAMDDLEPGQVMEVQATDKGSIADLKAWAKRAGHQYLGLIEDGNIINHYIRKLSVEDRVELTHPLVASNKELEAKLNSNDSVVIVDVREAAEFAFGHIPGAISIPLGELAGRFDELNKADEIYVICRSGNRSDLAAQLLAEYGFPKAINVLPGMSKWTGKTEGIKK